MRGELLQEEHSATAAGDTSPTELAACFLNRLALRGEGMFGMAAPFKSGRR